MKNEKIKYRKCCECGRVRPESEMFMVELDGKPVWRTKEEALLGIPDWRCNIWDLKNRKCFADVSYKEAPAKSQLTPEQVKAFRGLVFGISAIIACMVVAIEDDYNSKL